MALYNFGHFYVAHFLMHSISFELVRARVLKFHIWITHEKIADTYFFCAYQDYAPFLSYGLLKKYGWNLVSKVSQKLLKLEP